MLRKTCPYALFGRLLSILIGIALTVATAPRLARAAPGPYREVLRIGRGTVDSFAWRPDSKTLAVAGSLGVWIYTTDFQDIRYIPRTQEPSAGKIPVIWQPDGQHIATTGPRHTVEIYDAETGQLVLTYAGHTLPIASLAWSPDGTRIASASIDGTLHIWNTLTGQRISAAKEDTGVVPLAWSPDSRRVVSADGPDLFTLDYAEEDRVGKAVHIWDTQTGGLLRTIAAYEVVSLAWSADGKHIAGASLTDTVNVWDAETGEQLYEFMGFTYEVLAVAWSPDGKQVVGGGIDRYIQIWDVTAGDPVGRLYYSVNHITQIAWSPDGKLLAGIDRDDTLRIWDMTTRRPLHRLQGHSAPTRYVAWNPRETQIAASANYCRLEVFDADTGHLLFANKGFDYDVLPCRIEGVAWSPDGGKIAYINYSSGGGPVVVIDATTYEALFALEPASSLSWTADSRYLIAELITDLPTNYETTWDMHTGKALPGKKQQTLNGSRFAHWQKGQVIAWSPDGSRFATGGENAALHIWDAATGKLLYSPKKASFASWSPDGQQIACWGNGDVGRIQIRDAAIGSLIGFLEGHTAPVNAVVWSHGKLVSTSDDGTIRLWE